MRKVSVLLTLLVFMGCSLPPPQMPAQMPVEPKQSALTPGMAKKHIVIGKSTQADILETLGPPDMITTSKPGEMWGYDKVSREVIESSAGSIGGLGGGLGGLVGGLGGGVLGAGIGGIVGGVQQDQRSGQRTESTTTFFMLIYFDEKGVVRDYKLSATKF